MYSFDLLVLLASAVFYYRAAQFEDAPALLWSGLSVLTFLITWMVLSWGMIGSIAGQVALFLLITITRVVLEKKPVD